MPRGRGVAVGWPWGGRGVAGRGVDVRWLWIRVLRPGPGTSSGRHMWGRAASRSPSVEGTAWEGHGRCHGAARLQGSSLPLTAALITSSPEQRLPWSFSQMRKLRGGAHAHCPAPSEQPGHRAVSQALGPPRPGRSPPTLLPAGPAVALTGQQDTCPMSRHPIWPVGLVNAACWGLSRHLNYAGGPARRWQMAAPTVTGARGGRAVRGAAREPLRPQVPPRGM